MYHVPSVVTKVWLTSSSREKVFETCDDHHLIAKKVLGDEISEWPSKTSAIFRV